MAVTSEFNTGDNAFGHWKIPPSYRKALDNHLFLLVHQLFSKLKRNFSLKKGRILNNAGLIVALKPVKTIGKNSSPEEYEMSQLVHKIPCADCDYVYEGQTKRDLKT